MFCAALVQKDICQRFRKGIDRHLVIWGLIFEDVVAPENMPDFVLDFDFRRFYNDQKIDLDRFCVESVLRPVG